MTYCFILSLVKNGMEVRQINEYEYTSDIMTTIPSADYLPNAVKLQKEIVNKYTEDYKDECDSVVIHELEHSNRIYCLFPRLKDIIDPVRKTYYDYIVQLSKEENQRLQEDTEFINNEYFLLLLNGAKNKIETIRFKAEEFNKLDSQDYLDFLDFLNKASIDLDRPDTIKGKES